MDREATAALTASPPRLHTIAAANGAPQRAMRRSEHRWMITSAIATTPGPTDAANAGLGVDEALELTSFGNGR